MNINALEEIRQNLRRTRNQGVGRQQAEAYMQMASKLRRMLETEQEQQQQLKRLANMAYEVRDSNLAVSLEDTARRMNQELDILDDIVRQARAIANN